MRVCKHVGHQAPGGVSPQGKEKKEKKRKLMRISDIYFLMPMQACGEDLSKFSDCSFDAVVVSLVLCTVQDVKATVKEIRR